MTVLPPEAASSPGTRRGSFLGNLKAVLDAILNEDNRIGGRGVTRLVETLAEGETGRAMVESTIGFGENVDGAGDARFLINGEIIEAATRNSGAPFGFGTLSRALEATEEKAHPAGSIVLDLSRNTSAIDRIRRGFSVNTAVGDDLDVIARNLGLVRCPGITQEQLRRIIKAVAYLPKQVILAYSVALEALLGSSSAFTVEERLASDPWRVHVSVTTEAAADIRGRFMLNGGEPALMTSTTDVVVTYPVIESPFAAPLPFADKIIEGRTHRYPAGNVGTQAYGVYDDTPLTRRGLREGMTNYAIGGFASGTLIKTGSSPGPAGTPVIVDYAAFSAHYLAYDEATRQDTLARGHWAYLADPLLAARCLLDQIRAAGVRVEISALL